MINSVDDFNNVFFIGIAGTGMSALGTISSMALVKK
jgi:UDP-N-acetylmuramate-alanine ligase